MRVFYILIFVFIACYRQAYCADVKITASGAGVYEVKVNLINGEKAFRSGPFYRGRIEVTENGVKYFGIQKKVRKAIRDGYTVAVMPIVGDDTGKSFVFNIDIAEYVFFKDQSKFMTLDSDTFIVALPKISGSIVLILETSNGMIQSNQADIFQQTPWSMK